MKPQVGQYVTTRERVETYSFDVTQTYFEPGDIGIVAHVDVPCVRGKEGSTFNCIDFEKNGRLQRCALKNSQIVKVKQ